MDVKLAEHTDEYWEDLTDLMVALNQTPEGQKPFPWDWTKMWPGWVWKLLDPFESKHSRIDYVTASGSFKDLTKFLREVKNALDTP